MGVIEKILEEIEKLKQVYEANAFSLMKENNLTYGYNEIDIESAKVDAILDVLDTVRKHMNDGWIPVDRELPPNAKQKGVLCPKYQIMTKYGITEGWYNPDYESWFCLFWFMDNKFTNAYIDFEHGDVPKMVQIEKGIDLVQAWRHLPEPYKPERSDNHDRE